jgi:HEAT repeat protein
MESPEQILEAALRLPVDSSERWSFVEELHKRGDSATFRAASAFVASSDPVRRGLGVDVLAQLGAYPNVPVQDRPFSAQTVRLLLDHLPEERDPEVLASVAFAFGHLGSTSALHDLRNHSDEGVRHAVVFGLLGVDEDVAVQTLIELSADESAQVRDWATFALGVESKRDDPDVRKALFARLTDPDDDTREEAIRGLATRGDQRAIPQLLRELSTGGSPDDPYRIEEALLALASSTGDAQLCKHVRAIHADWQRDTPDKPLPDDLQSAIRACLHTA